MTIIELANEIWDQADQTNREIQFKLGYLGSPLKISSIVYEEGKVIILLKTEL